jgi:histidine phosphotransferase ChpT
MAMVVISMDAQLHHDRMCLELASALCARLCHDISSPLGTLSGTLELASEEPEQAEEALALAGEAATFMVNRLQLLRAAWAGDCGPMNRSRLAGLTAGLPGRVKAKLDELSPGPFDGPLARVLLNLLMLGAEALPSGGVVALSGEPATGIILTVEGRSVRWDAGLASALLDPPSAPATDPRMVQMPLTARLAHAAGLRLSFLTAATHGPDSAPRLLLAPG